jgi:peptidyl-prolyl cis-trans isomerase D
VEPQEFPYKDDALRTAFAQNKGETGPVMDDRKGNYFVTRTDSVTPSALRPFDQARDDVLAAWKSREQAKRAEAEAASIAKILREGRGQSSFATHEGVTVSVSKPVSLLGDSDPALPKSALPQIFNMKKGDVIVLPEEGRQVILRLADVVDLGESKDEDILDKIASDLDRVAPKELADQYLKYLRVLFPVTIRQDALDGLAQQGG